jgi:Mg2+ and Co2+ transporter CorA
MLGTDFPFAIRRWPQRALAFLLGEPFLGFLAVVAVALTVLPMLFTVQPATDALIEAGQWMIVAIFGVEYVLALLFAPARRAFLLNPWRLVDLATVAIPLLTLLPGVTGALRSSPVLRLVRLARVITLGMRVSGVVVRDEARRETEQRTRPVEVSRVSEDGHSPAHSQATWDDFLRWMRTPGPQWYNVSNVGQDEARKMAAAAGIAPSFIESHLLGASYPHLEVTERYLALFIWVPGSGANAQVERNGLLLLGMGNSLITLSRQAAQLFDLIAAVPLTAQVAQLPFAARMTSLFLRAVVTRNEEWVGRLETEVRALEELPVRESRPQFFERTFRLKKDLSTAQSDLWRLKAILAEFAGGRATFPGGGAGAADFFRGLASDAEYLYETAVNTREGLLSLIELHLNVVSFDMNRVMRVLAVVSVLGLIPGVVGGLFGMNLSDNPWPFTLSQVAFAVVFGMVLCLYLFFVKGWLR